MFFRVPFCRRGLTCLADSTVAVSHNNDDYADHFDRKKENSHAPTSTSNILLPL